MTVISDRPCIKVSPRLQITPARNFSIFKRYGSTFVYFLPRIFSLLLLYFWNNFIPFGITFFFVGHIEHFNLKFFRIQAFQTFARAYSLKCFKLVFFRLVCGGHKNCILSSADNSKSLFGFSRFNLKLILVCFKSSLLHLKIGPKINF